MLINHQGPPGVPIGELVDRLTAGEGDCTSLLKDIC
jgi:hypothetical protein